MLCAIVVAYKNGSELLDCCEALALAPEIRYVIVVNNSYAEAGVALIATSAALAGKIIHLMPNRNLGYAAGNNLGISRAAALGATKVLVCNPDIVILSAGVSGLLKEMNDAQVDLISPYLIERNSAGELQDLRSPGWDLAWGRGVIESRSSRSNQNIIPTFFGACFIATTALMHNVGMLSEDLFLYGEEIDFCMRMDNNKTYRWQLSNHHGAHHARGTSISPLGASPRTKSSVAYQHAARSAVIIGRKYWPRRVWLWICLRLGSAIALFFTGGGRAAWAVVKGVVGGLSAKLDRRPNSRV